MVYKRLFSETHAQSTAARSYKSIRQDLTPPHSCHVAPVCLYTLEVCLQTNDTRYTRLTTHRESAIKRHWHRRSSSTMDLGIRHFAPLWEIQLPNISFALFPSRRHLYTFMFDHSLPLPPKPRQPHQRYHFRRNMWEVVQMYERNTCAFVSLTTVL